MSVIVVKTGFQEITVPEGLLKKADEIRGKRNAPHVDDLKETIYSTYSLIEASVMPEMNIRKSPYKVRINVNNQRLITEANCSCVCGITGSCKHTAAVIYMVNTERDTTKTDKECTFNKPSVKNDKSERYAKAKKIKELYPLKTPASPPTFQEPSEEEKASYLALLEECGDNYSHYYHLLTAEKKAPPPVPDLEPDVQSLFPNGQGIVHFWVKNGGLSFKTHYALLTDDQREFYDKLVLVKTGEGDEICR